LRQVYTLSQKKIKGFPNRPFEAAHGRVLNRRGMPSLSS
jgi:hypothetical protein